MPLPTDMMAVRNALNPGVVGTALAIRAFRPERAPQVATTGITATSPLATIPTTPVEGACFSTNPCTRLLYCDQVRTNPSVGQVQLNACTQYVIGNRLCNGQETKFDCISRAAAPGLADLQAGGQVQAPGIIAWLDQYKWWIVGAAALGVGGYLLLK